MHEFSICRALLDVVFKEVKNQTTSSPRILKTNLVVGQLRQIIAENMKFAYEILTKDTPAADSVLEIKYQPAKGECRQCGWKEESADFITSCNRCGSIDIELLAGKELIVASVEVDEE